MRTAPKISVEGFQGPQFNTLGAGATDRIFLLGHADGLILNEPFPVTNVNAAIDAMKGDRESPLVRGLLQAYHAGARDIWLMAIDTMDSYEPDLDLRDSDYYVAHREALSAAYGILAGFDAPQIVVPLEAPFNSTQDFLTPLVAHCAKAFDSTGEIRLGFLGTRGVLSEGIIDQMIIDPRLSNFYGEAGKFVSLFAGDGVFNFPELGVTHTASAATVAAAQLAASPMDRGIMGRKVLNMFGISGQDLKSAQLEDLALAGVNALHRTYKGKRGAPYEVTFYTDNTLAQEGSDYSTLSCVRLVAQVVSQIKGIGNRRIGTVGFGVFKGDVEAYLLKLVSRNVIRGYSVNIERSQKDLHSVYVDLVLRPYSGVRELYVPITVGNQS